MALLDELAEYLEDAGVGTVGTTIFMSALHDTAMPQRCIALFEYPGRMGLHVHDQPLMLIEYPSVAVHCRAPNYVDARADAEAVMRALEAVVNTTLSGVHYLAVRANQPPFSIGEDSNERAQVVVNFSVEKELSA